MKPPDLSLGNLTPLQPAPSLTRWGIDHIQVGPKVLLNAIEYATGWLEPRLVPNADFANIVPLLLYKIQTFGKPKQVISDNACCFNGIDVQTFQTAHSLSFTRTTPAKPRSNGKVEQANCVLKSILIRILLDNSTLELSQALA
ncbi:hypothetical protein K3495_g10186 [Podosphaera aphanis]|nr:hypothetical protein K3495_g10186 [Podosphaera aphanis]